MDKTNKLLQLSTQSLVIILLLRYFYDIERLEQTGESTSMTRPIRRPRTISPGSVIARDERQKRILNNMNAMTAILQNRDVYLRGFIPAPTFRRIRRRSSSKVHIQDWCSVDLLTLSLNRAQDAEEPREGHYSGDRPLYWIWKMIFERSTYPDKRKMVEQVVGNRDIRSIVDPHCLSNAVWLRPLMRIWSRNRHEMKLTCVVYSSQQENRAKDIFRPFSNVQVKLARGLKRSLRVKADLVLLFDILVDQPLDRTQEALIHLSSSGSKFALMTLSRERQPSKDAPSRSELAISFVRFLERVTVGPSFEPPTRIFNLELFPFCRWPPLETSQEYRTFDGNSVQWFGLYSADSLVPGEVLRSLT
mmetsp:Transcript_1641/g.3077  ORF Transcript_1641/g.3077 Transcript_1641/m.3077 type:complete len:361 (-) Transcript_1641:1038-2120(-)